MIQAVKVSKSQKEIVVSPHTPKNKQQNFSHFLAYPIRSVQIKKIVALLFQIPPSV